MPSSDVELGDYQCPDCGSDGPHSGYHEEGEPLTWVRCGSCGYEFEIHRPSGPGEGPQLAD
jgi:hypothetical protein